MSADDRTFHRAAGLTGVVRRLRLAGLGILTSGRPARGVWLSREGPGSVAKRILSWISL